MQPSSFHQLPPFFLLLAVLLAVVVAILQVGVLRYAYEKLGISRTAAYWILLLTLLGSIFNIPFLEVDSGKRTVEPKQVKDQWGMKYMVFEIKEWPASIAINVGGAVIPTLLSIYLIFRHELYAKAALGVFAISAVVFRLAEPVPEMGIAVPILLPPIAAAVVAMLLSREHAAPLAYISGCLGTLIGADLLNLNVMAQLGASVAVIGGAGQFDAIFLTGMLAVLLAVGPRKQETTALADIE